MISVAEARNRILDAFSPLELEKVCILDALGRVIGEDVYAGRSLPPKDNSAMDGYALRAEDTRGASVESPVRLAVVEDIPAGAVPQKHVGPGEAVRIMTGAPIPEGADAVVRMEDSRADGSRVVIVVEVRKGQEIRNAGADVRQGEKVIPRGEIIRPAEVGMLASLGRSFILVHQRPLVAIVATGDELADVDESPSEWKIIGSNSYSLAALVRECGGVPLQIGIARDRREDLLAAFRAAMRADLIVSSGGVSGGDYDLVKEIMQEAGNAMQFWQVAMKPGRSLAFGALGNVPAVGLPGNPVSSMASFEMFIRPAILKMLGQTNLFRRTVRARLGEEIVKEKGIMQFIRARILREGAGYAVVTGGGRGSGILKSMVGVNGLVVLPEEAAAARVGEMVTVQFLDDSLERVIEPGV
ncbi:MAG: molybdopterin molybdotransferase MoeA [Syntrophales bacterium]